MRLIDADKLLNRMQKDPLFNLVERYGINNVINAEPTIDAIEVVRCKDCKWGKEVCGNIECWTDMNLPPEYHGYYWYCPNGERKEE